MKKYSIFLILVLFSLFLNSCKYDFVMPEVIVPPNPDVKTLFATEIVPILAEKCVLCHSTQAPTMGASVAYAQLVPGYVNTTTPASSKLYVKATSGTHGGTVSATQGALILKWITEGALNN